MQIPVSFQPVFTERDIRPEVLYRFQSRYMVSPKPMIRYSASHSSTYEMDPESDDREERKREYNRLAQREFRRRRKEHLKSLEQAQKERTSEQSGEIERLRHQNAELKRENEALKAQIYGLSSSSQHGQMPNSITSSHHTHHHYPDSPSISSTIDSLSGTGSPPPSITSDMMPMGALSLASSSVIPPSLQEYNDALLLSYFPAQRYPMVTSSSVRHDARSSPGSSDFGSPQPTMGTASSLQYMNVSRTSAPQSQQGPPRSSYREMSQRNGYESPIDAFMVPARDHTSKYNRH